MEYPGTWNKGAMHRSVLWTRASQLPHGSAPTRAPNSYQGSAAILQGGGGLMKMRPQEAKDIFVGVY